MLQLRSRRNAAAALRFIDMMDPARELWVLGAWKDAWTWKTFHGPERAAMAEAWIDARYAEGVEVYMLLGDVAAPYEGDNPLPAVISSRFVAATAGREDVFLARCAGNTLGIHCDAVGRFICLWELPSPVSPKDACAQSGGHAAHCCEGGRAAHPLLHYIPLPATMTPAPRGAIVRAPMRMAPARYAETGRQLAPGAMPVAPQPRFVRGDSLAFNTLKWLWPNLLLANAFSLVGGEAGVGKSTVCATIAAAVTTGGRWPTGENIEPGAVVYCEIEDDLPSVTGPALAAAGADMSRIDFCDAPFDLAADIGPLVARVRALERDTGVKVRLVVLSPVRNFFGAKESYVDSEVRARLHRICEWAQQNDVAILGILHPKQQAKDAFAGASAWKDVARAGIFAKWTDARGGPRHIEPLKTNSGKYGWRLPFEIEGAWPSGFESKRVVWLAEQPEGEPVAQLVDEDDDGNRKIDLAIGALCRLLPIGASRPGADIKREMAAEGFSKGTTDNAADALGVRREDGPGRSKLWSR
jgi:putative DNA primase/helicase